MKNSIKILPFILIFVFSLSFIKPNVAYAKNEVLAESMITMEVSSGRILSKKDENKRLPMASTTKILTAIVAIENCNDLDKKYEIPVEAVGIEGSSIYLKKGEHLSVRELLYGLMLRSGNDSAVAIAILVSGSIENFVNLMNQKCKELGLVDTHIVTVNGLHNDEHYTTAKELGIISCYALHNPLFREIVSTKEKIISNEFDLKNKQIRLLKNKNKLLKMIDGADGVKTGFTRKAGRCFVGSATRNDMQIVCVVLNCQDWFNVAAREIENAFKSYKLKTIIDVNKLNNFEGDKKVYLKNNFSYPLSDGEFNHISAKINYYDKVQKENSEYVIGTFDVYLENKLIFSQKLYTIYSDKDKEESSLKKIFRLFV